MTEDTYIEARRYPGQIWKWCYDQIVNLKAGVVAAGSISTDELADNAVDTNKIKDAAVTASKVALNGITAARFAGATKSFTSAGVTIAALTTAIAAPGTLPDGYIAIVKDSSDSNKTKIVTVLGGAFYVSAAQTAAA